jgi:hypothetical protein
MGQFPIVALLTALGLCLCSIADALSRATMRPTIWILWAGVALVVAPAVYRLCSAEASVRERTALVVLVGLGLYAVKMMRDPFGLDLPDEWIHAFNAQQIAASHHLFGFNSLLPATSRYPGLESATVAVMSLTGMSSFGAGTIVVAAANVTLMLSLFVLFMSASGSARVAGLAAVAYAGNSNFLFFGDMFSYESLALPLMVFVLALIAVSVDMSDVRRRAFAVPLMAATFAVTITHHLTSYLLDVLLMLLAALPSLSRQRIRSLRISRLAWWSVSITVVWLLVVASETVGYIAPTIDSAFVETLSTLRGESAAHLPFSNAGTGSAPTPVDQKIVSLAAIVILFVALPFGLYQIWRHHRRSPFALLFGVAAVGYFAALGFRLSPSAWEIANRSDEFLFVGLGFVVAYAVAAWMNRPLRHVWLWRSIAGLSAAIVLIGDTISGYTVSDILTPPTVIRADGVNLPSQTLALAEWVRQRLPHASFAAADGDARALLLDGNVRVKTANTAHIDYTLRSLSLPGVGPLHVWRTLDLPYAVVDLRERGQDNSAAYAWSVRPGGGEVDILWPRGVAQKFDDIPAPRVYDSGDLHIYDLKGLE